MRERTNMLAKIISTISSPFIIIPIFGLWVTSVYTDTINRFLALGISFIVFIVLLPFIYVYIGVKNRRFTDLHLAIREQREKPFLISILGAILLLVAYYFQNAPKEGTELATLILVNGIIFYLITRFWKISVHSAAFFGSTLVVSMFIDPMLVTLSTLVPFIVWARLKRDNHNFSQTISSIVVVGASTFLVHYFFT